MKVLYVAMKYDYGKRERGYSFEHYNFYHSLIHMGHDVLYFDFMSLMQEGGRQWMNRRLLEVVKAEKPELMFTVLFTGELDRAAVREISENTDTTSLNWFCDDHWRFDNYSRYWAPCFNWVVTTARSALPKYERLGYPRVIKSQWACNHFLYRRHDLPLEHEVSFVGQPHGNRREIVQALRDAGVDVKVWGTGWESGRLSQEDMIRVFSTSRINLNLSNPSEPTLTPLHRVWKGVRTRLSHAGNAFPFGRAIKSIGKRYLSTIENLALAAKSSDYLRSKHSQYQYIDQIKGRNFEIPGCGGFLLTGRAEDLESYYEIDKEVVCFDDTHDLLEKLRYYMTHEEERAAIAHAGYRRTLRDHTYPHRFAEIFQRMGLVCEPVSVVLEGEVPPGQTKEVH
jgi:spore maturation protein CgeB